MGPKSYDAASEARAPRLAEQHGGDVDTLTDFRAICNYVIKF